MKKLLSIIFFLLFTASAFAAHPSPAQWSLAGVASWAQILTASGTAAPTDTAAFTIGDFYARNTAGSSTVTLYRLCASGTGAIWNVVGGAGGTSGATSLTLLTDLPTLDGNDGKYLKYVSGVNFAWETPAAEGLAEHVASSTSPHGETQSIGTHYFQGYGGYARKMATNDDLTIMFGQVVIASYTDTFTDSYPALAPASSTQAIGVFTYNGIANAATYSLVMMEGETDVMVAVDSADIALGDWVVTSDTAPGMVERASVVGDSPLPYDEAQRAIGICNILPYYDSVTAATYTWIILKGLR